MTKFVDLKRRPTDPEDKQFYKDPQKEEYYPLNLYLDKVEMEKLGLSGVKIGDETVLICKCRVTHKSESESEQGPDNKSISLAVTGAMVEPIKPTNEERAARLFPGAK